MFVSGSIELANLRHHSIARRRDFLLTAEELTRRNLKLAKRTIVAGFRAVVEHVVPILELALKRGSRNVAVELNPSISIINELEDRVCALNRTFCFRKG